MEENDRHHPQKSGAVLPLVAVATDATIELPGWAVSIGDRVDVGELKLMSR